TLTALGVIVIEAAGNGTHDLDGPAPPSGVNLRTRDSGAILVGAAVVTVEDGTAVLRRRGNSNWGSRVGCCAAGQDGYTADAAEDGSVSDYTRTFQGTSSAAAIVAGAAVLTQQYARQQLRRSLSPREMRDLLYDPRLNTPTHDPATDRIGVMPNLRKIF